MAEGVKPINFGAGRGTSTSRCHRYGEKVQRGRAPGDAVLGRVIHEANYDGSKLNYGRAGNTVNSQCISRRAH